MTTKDILRQVRFAPYLGDEKPQFRLTLWDTGRTRHGKSILGYRLSIGRTGAWKALFDGEDFCCSPMHAIDGDATVAAVMKFLTLRPGDTDREYFAEYTPQQLSFCSEHAEALMCRVSFWLAHRGRK